MGKLLEMILGGLMVFPILSFAQEDQDILSTDVIPKRELIPADEKTSLAPTLPPNTELLTQEDPVKVVSESLASETIEVKDVVNFMARIDEETIEDRSRYSQGPFLENFMYAFEDRINRDPFFSAWEDYKEDDFILKNQAISGLWDVLVGRYPKTFGRVEKAGKGLKRITTLNSPEVRGYRFKLNPELDSDNYPRVKMRVKSSKNTCLDDLQFRVGKEEMAIGKTYELPKVGKSSTFSLDLQYDYHNNYSVILTFKIPFWFNLPKEK